MKFRHERTMTGKILRGSANRGDLAMARSRLTIFGVLLLLPALGLGAMPAAAAQAESKEAWGTLKGRIVWGGMEIPEAKPVMVPRGGLPPVPDETWVVHPRSRGLRDTMVWL